MGAACELVAFYGWPGADVEFEVGEFDTVVDANDRVVLAVEAKARIDGPDSLTRLWESFVDYAANEAPPEPTDNHSRKYVELLRLTETGPVVVWLVAARARWSVLATRLGSRVELSACGSVERRAVAARTSPSRPPPAKHVLLRPDESHALQVGRLTELDGQQRCYEFPWRDEAALDRFLDGLRQRAIAAGLAHARPWKWRSETSGGPPLSPCGRTTV